MAIDERLTREMSTAVPARPRAGTRSPAVHVVLLAATFLSAALTEIGDPSTLVANPALLLNGLPFAATLITILLVHELGHFLTCLRYRVSATLPYFIPAPLISPVGTFGAFIRIRSRFPDRRALFDIGAAGPWAGFVVALAATGIGLAHSTVLAAPQEEHGYYELGDSLLTTFLTRAVLHADSATVLLHPVAFAGWFGLFVTSMNLIPVGQLDGGHVLYAALGRRIPWLPPLLISFLVWLGVRGSPGWLLWAFIITALWSLGHPPTEDDRRPLGTARLLAALATFVVFVLTFVPEPIKIHP